MFDELVKQIAAYSPSRIILFGSQAKGTATERSDIDICVIISTGNKRRLAAELQALIDCDMPVDILIYTPEEWEECRADATSFAHVIDKEGTVLYG